MRFQLLITLILLSFFAAAQELKETTDKKDNLNYLSLYPEFGGNSLTVSLNAEYTHLYNDNKSGIYLRGGAGYIYAGTSVLLEGGFLIGKNRNYFDLGFGYTKSIDLDDDNMFTIRAGYRRMGKNGFMFRVSPMLLTFIYLNGNTETWPWAGLSLGYSFPLR